MIKRVCTFYFSATDTTKKVVEEIADIISENLSLEKFEYNFTLAEKRKTMPEFTEEDLVICGVPTIAGRVPNLLLPYLETINANGSLGVAIALYGNRNVDDCLIELADLMTNGKMKVIAAGAFVGEHSFSKTLAANRPDQKDFEIIREFSNKIIEKIKNEDYSIPEIVGEKPYRFYYLPRDRHGTKINFVKIKPETNRDICIDCKICAKVCPLSSINFDKVWEVPGKCMKCCACIKKCPTGAKYFDDEGYLYHQKELEEIYERRDEPKYFI